MSVRWEAVIGNQIDRSGSQSPAPQAWRVRLIEWVKLQLDLSTFDDSRFEPYLRRCQQSGVGLTTVAEIGDSPGTRRSLFELNRICSADILGRGEFYTFEEYLGERINVPSYDPHGVALAIDGDVWIGMAATSQHPERGFAFSEMTGVLTGYRGRGVSVAMNRRLGFVDEDPHLWTA
jgi:hypothetical protein